MDKYHKKTKKFLHQGLFNAVSSFKEFEGRIENLDSKQDKGDAFEVFAQAYLATQKIVQAKMIWAFDDIPQNVRSNISIDTHIDMGVDGAFEMNTGEQCAYQVKFRTGRPYLTWTELSTFMGLTEQADKRVLFTNCDDIPDLMNNRSNFYCIRGSDLDRLEVDDFRAIKAWLEGGQVKFKQYYPLPHQEKALQKIELAFKDADRATVVMACGTGKTLVQLWAAEMLNVNSVLVLVPSLALVRQTLHEWLKQTKWENYSYLCVCSDPSVKGSDEVIVKQSELDFPVTTNREEVARYLNTDTKGPHIVFSTYQSAQVVAEGMSGSFKFDLAIFDEAHKTAGREGTRFAFALDDENLRICKRLFMTATPRHYNVQKKDKEGDSKLVYSMDVPEVYGETVYNLQFREAVNDDLICDYKVLISVVTDEVIDDWQLSHGEVIVKGNVIKARQVANQVALKNAVDEYGVRHIFTFHSSVNSAKSFTSQDSEGINSELPDFVTVHVNGAMTAAKRSHNMREFADADQAVISNARCLTEGVDVPAVDMVAFLSPKKSKVDIVQATGRAMRKAGTKEVGYVLVPLYLEQEKGESLEEALERTDFSEIWNVLQAMKEQDDDLADVIRDIQEERGKTGGYDDSRLREHLEVLGPALNLATLRNSVVTQCVERLGEFWDLMFGELVSYKKLHGDCNVSVLDSKYKQLGMWVGTQRRYNRQGNVTAEHVSRLEELGFVWDLYESTWEAGLSELQAYKYDNGDCNVPQGYQVNPQLGSWVNKQRQNFKKGKLPAEQVRRLQELGMIWDPTEYAWETRFRELQAYKGVHGDCNVSQVDSQYQELGKWVVNQRIRFKQGKLLTERIRRLEVLGFIWDILSSKREEMLSELHTYKDAHGSSNVPKDYPENRELAKWASRQRNRFKQGKLSADLVKRLNELEFVWYPLEHAWETQFKKLQAFKEANGHCNVPKLYQEDLQLGKWVGRQRTLYKKGKLTGEQIHRLEELKIIWNTYMSAWEKHFSELQAHKDIYGHCNVSASYSVVPKLSSWVTIQRRKHKQGKLNDEQVQRLEEIGFVWDMNKNDE